MYVIYISPECDLYFYWPLSVMCVYVCVFVRVILNQCTSKKNEIRRQTSVNLMTCCIHTVVLLVTLLDMFIFIIPLIKIAHLIWNDYLFRKRCKATERVGGCNKGV